MSGQEEYAPRNQETDPNYNTEPGIAYAPGSAWQREMLKYEQFPWTRIAQGMQPGNPYVKREFPKMLYRAYRYPGTGKVQCMAAPPDLTAFTNQSELMRAEEACRRFNESCTRIVQDEREMTRALQEGWREHPDDAVAFVNARDAAESEAAANRAYEDRNLSEKAKREIAAAEEETDGHLAEVPRKPVRRRKAS